MDRYADTYPGDSAIATDGDSQFTGMDARIQPEKLDPGTVAYSQNMRFTNYTGQVRLGMQKMTNGIVVNGNALIIPFIVGSSAILTTTVSDGVFGTTAFSDPNNNNLESLVIFTGAKAYTLSASSALASLTYPANELIETSDQVDYVQYGNDVYLFRGQIGVQIPTSTLTSSGTTATFTSTGATGLSSGMYVQVAGSNFAPYNGNFLITVTGANTFTYVLPSSTTSPATGTIVVNRLKTPMKWNGVAGGGFVLTSYGVISQNFSFIQGANFALIQANRSILQYTRNGLIVSQVENPEVDDTINGVFNFGPGTADYLVGVAPYQDNYTLVFLRHSVWLIDGIALDVAAMSTQIMTNTVGCVSKRTIQTCGANVLFLSDLGVYQFVPGYELALRGNVLPLSAPVQPFINRINYNATNVPCAAYVNSRYYLAVPLDGSLRNNAMLVYNFINSAWESLDTFPNGFFCDFLTVMLNNTNTLTLYCSSMEGGIYTYEQLEQDQYGGANQPPANFLIQGQLLTRRLIFGTNTLKKYNRAIASYDMDASSGMACEAVISDPDDTRTMPTVTVTTAERVTRPMIINKRGAGLQLQFSNTANRATVLNYQVGAYIKDMKSVQTT